MTVADSLFDYLLEAFPAGRSYTPAQFERPPMPPLVANYLARSLEQRLTDDLEQLRTTASDWCDAEATEVEEALRQLSGALARHGRIPAEAWQPLLREAVDQVAAFLVHPAETLTRHVFAHRDGPVPAAVVHRRLAFFDAYPYLHEVVEAYLEQRKLEQIDRNRFNALLVRIDRQMTEDYTPADWVRMLDPLFELAALPPDASGAVPIETLHDFFAAKDAAEPVRRLQRARSQGNTALTGDALHDVLEAREEPPQPAPSRWAPPPKPPEPQTPPARRKTPTEDGPLPLWKKFQRGDYTPEPGTGPSHEPAPPPSPAPPAQAAPAPTPPAGQENVPLWKRFQSPLSSAGSPAGSPSGSASAAPSGLPAVERAVLGDRGTRNRDLFVKHLFSGSSDDYERTLRQLSEAPSWTHASQIIAQEVFLRHQVNIYSEPAVAFTDAVEARFRE